MLSVWLLKKEFLNTDGVSFQKLFKIWLKSLTSFPFEASVESTGGNTNCCIPGSTNEIEGQRMYSSWTGKRSLGADLRKNDSSWKKTYEVLKGVSFAEANIAPLDLSTTSRQWSERNECISWSRHRTMVVVN